jgi:hypothetical protein
MSAREWGLTSAFAGRYALPRVTVQAEMRQKAHIQAIARKAENETSKVRASPPSRPT